VVLSILYLLLHLKGAETQIHHATASYSWIRPPQQVASLDVGRNRLRASIRVTRLGRGEFEPAVMRVVYSDSRRR
jgi:hypothetical protein